MSLAENSNQAILPGVVEHGLFLYAICKVMKFLQILFN